MQSLYRILIGLGLGLTGSDRLRLYLVRRLALWRRPKAARFFDHYLRGGGASVRIRTDELLREDRGVRRALRGGLHESLAEGATEGRLSISQLHASDPDWRFALGSVCFDWRATGDRIEVAASGMYRWHADEPRISQAVHRLAERMRRYGARSFAFTGQPTHLPKRGLSPSLHRPIHTYLM